MRLLAQPSGPGLHDQGVVRTICHMVGRVRPNWGASVSGVVIALGGMVAMGAHLFGWQTVLDLLSRPVPMRYMSAVCFTLLGVSIYGASRGGLLGRLLSTITGIIIFTISTFTILDIFFQLDQPAPLMSLGASLSFTAYAAAMILTRRGSKAAWLSQGAAMAGWVFAMVAVVGHLYDTPSLYTHSLFGATGLGSTVLALLSGFAIMCIDRSEAFTKLYLSDSSAGSNLRAMIPTIIVAPLIIGLIAVQGTKGGVYERGVGIAFATLATIVVFGSMSWRNAAALLNREKRLVQANEDIRLMATMLETDRVAIIRADASGEITSWNRPAEELYGYTADEVLGQSIDMLEDQEFPTQEHPSIYEIEVLDLYRKTKANDIVEVSVSRYPVRDADGRTSAYADVSRNVSEIRQLERYSHTMFEASPVPKLIFGTDRKVRSVNPACAESFGYDREELIGAPFDALLSEPVPNGTSYTHNDKIGHRRDGSVFLARVSLNTFRVGREDLTIAIILDVTLERQMEKETVRTQKLQGIAMFAGTLTHEFNNYLTTIIGNAALAMSELEPESEAYEYCSRIESVSHRAASLVKRVLQFSRMDKPDTVVGSLKSLVHETVAIARTTILAGWEIAVHTSPNLWAAPFDAGQAEQALMNLLKNSSEQSEEGRIDVTLANELVGDEHPMQAHGQGRFVRMSVRDNCGGIDAHAVDRLFEPFFTNKASGKGTGLGLPVVDGILKAHGGFATVENEPGVGLTIHLYFPAAEDEGEPILDSILDSGQLELAID